LKYNGGTVSVWISCANFQLKNHKTQQFRLYAELPVQAAHHRKTLKIILPTFLNFWAIFASKFPVNFRVSPRQNVYF
jgi:hypothetical protein